MGHAKELALVLELMPDVAQKFPRRECVGPQELEYGCKEVSAPVDEQTPTAVFRVRNPTSKV